MTRLNSLPEIQQEPNTENVVFEDDQDANDLETNIKLAEQIHLIYDKEGFIGDQESP